MRTILLFDITEQYYHHTIIILGIRNEPSIRHEFSFQLQDGFAAGIKKEVMRHQHADDDGARAGDDWNDSSSKNSNKTRNRPSCCSTSNY